MTGRQLVVQAHYFEVVVREVGTGDRGWSIGRGFAFCISSWGGTASLWGLGVGVGACVVEHPDSKAIKHRLTKKRYGRAGLSSQRSRLLGVGRIVVMVLPWRVEWL